MVRLGLEVSRWCGGTGGGWEGGAWAWAGFRRRLGHELLAGVRTWSSSSPGVGTEDSELHELRRWGLVLLRAFWEGVPDGVTSPELITANLRPEQKTGAPKQKRGAPKQETRQLFTTIYS